MASNKMIRKVGSFYSCIAGDHSYSDTLNVYVEPDRVWVEHIDSSRRGGMDCMTSETNSTSCAAVRVNITPGADLKAVAKELVANIKDYIRSERRGASFHYGKPTKNFKWNTADGSEYGINTALALKAIEYGIACCESYPRACGLL